MNRVWLWVAGCVLAIGDARAEEPTSHADDVPARSEVIVIEGRAPDGMTPDRDRALGAAPFVTVLHAGDHPVTASVADALATSAGVQIRSLGGLGAYQSVSVRGAAPGHTAVLVDGVPLSRLAEVTTDLGRFAIDAFGEVELYRGAVPVELGGAGVGGAVNLVTRLGRGVHGERVRVSIGAGSFGARHARLHYGDDHAWGASSTTLGYQGATGDYSYFTDRGTPLNPSDDGYEVRRNNHFDQLDLASRVASPDRRVIIGARVAWKHQGLPGSVAQPALAPSLATLDAIVDARIDAHLGEAIARQLGFVLIERQVLRDPMGELGLGAQHREYRTIAAGASSTWSRRFGGHRGVAGIELRGDGFGDVDRAEARSSLSGTRLGGALSFAGELSLAPQLVVTPALRLEVVDTAPTPRTEGPDAFVEVPSRVDVVPSPRVTAHARIADDVAIKGSAGWYARLPTLLEVFGDRGSIVGSPDLLPERGYTGDVGAVWAPGAPIGQLDRILVESALFATRARDTIALVSSAGFVARAENVGATQSYGAELVVAGRLARAVSLTTSYTRLVTEQRTIDPNLFGKALPRAPGHQVAARVELARRIAGRDAGVWADAVVQSASFLDRANFQRVPARALVGTGARVAIAGGVAVALSVANLAGTRVVTVPAERAIDSPTPTALADLAGFPLPGRSFYVSLDWTH